VGRTSGTTNITTANTIDDSSNIGLGIIGQPLTGTLNGSIRIISPTYIDNVQMPMRTPFRNYGLKVTVSNPTITTSFPQFKTNNMKMRLKKLGVAVD
jgi:hypothetical protein